MRDMNLLVDCVRCGAELSTIVDTDILMDWEGSDIADGVYEDYNVDVRCTECGIVQSVKLRIRFDVIDQFEVDE